MGRLARRLWGMKRRKDENALQDNGCKREDEEEITRFCARAPIDRAAGGCLFSLRGKHYNGIAIPPRLQFSCRSLRYENRFL